MAASDQPHSHSYGQCQVSIKDCMAELKSFEESADHHMRKSKIICTMGPSCWDVEMLVQLIDCGMNVARLNFSHGDHEGHGSCITRIREACKQRPGKHVAILLDTKGPEIRTGFFKEGKTIDLVAGEELKVVMDYEFKGDKNCIAVSYDKLCKSVKVGGIILCADGSLSLKVKSIGDDHVITEVMNACKLGERKNCNLPGVAVELPVLQEKDINDIQNFGLVHGVDFVAASFVQNANDVKFIRETLGERGRNIHIISKIENEEGLKNFDEICRESDAIMVARGDLGMEIAPEKVFLAQKVMIAKCNLHGKPVITATQMLESMTALPRPTRAEASDVANSVLDGTDCVMLSGETAGGAFPREAVTIMRRICEEAEGVLDYASLYSSVRMGTLGELGGMTDLEALCSSGVKTTIDCDCKLIIALTESGATARALAKYRPKVPILAVSASEQTIRQMNVVRGVTSMLVESFAGTDSVINKALTKAKEEGMVKSGDAVVCIHSQEEAVGSARPAGSSNLMKIATVP